MYICVSVSVCLCARVLSATVLVLSASAWCGIANGIAPLTPGPASGDFEPAPSGVLYEDE